MSIFTSLNILQQKQAQKIAKSDETRVTLHDRIGCTESRACVTNGHVAYSWDAPSAKDGAKYNATTGIPLPPEDDYQFPNFAPLFVRPKNLNKIVVSVPSNTSGRWSLMLVDSHYVWAKLAANQIEGVSEATRQRILFTVDMAYLRDACAFVQGEKPKKGQDQTGLVIEYTDDMSQLFVSDTDRPDLQVVVMPCRL